MLTHVPVVAQLLPEQNLLGRYKFNITCMLIYRLCFSYISLARFGEYDSHFQVLRTFALIVYAHPYCVSNSCRNVMLRHA